jgi:hypothetical protein
MILHNFQKTHTHSVEKLAIDDCNLGRLIIQTVPSIKKITYVPDHTNKYNHLHITLPISDIFLSCFSD